MESAPSNHGARWTVEQDAWVIKAVQKKTGIYEIAQKMNRTNGSIIARLKLIACTEIETGRKTIDEAALMTTLSISVIKEELDKREAQRNAKKEGSVKRTKEPIQRKVDINDTSEKKGEVITVAKPRLDEATLNQEQRDILEKVYAGKNALMTGGAGAGKSYCMKFIVQWATDNGKNIGITAMTGSAAVLIDGCTLHSFLGIGLAKDSAEGLVRKIHKSRTDICDRLSKLDILLVDEVSMMNDELFDKVSEFLSLFRKNARPFGGIQIILVGDAFQLSPVEGKYFFLGKLWDTSEFEVCILTANMRQKDDLEFKQLLDRVRMGVCSTEDLKALRGLKDTVFPEGIIPTRLYSVNRDVDKINEDEFQCIIEKGKGTTKIMTYAIKYHGNSDSHKLSKKWAEAVKLRNEIQLCVGAQVMLTRNMTTADGIYLVNGARGVVTSISPSAVYVNFVNSGMQKIEFFRIKPEFSKDKSNTDTSSTDEVMPSVNLSYIPLQLAWAISIHKSQGMTLDAVEIDLGGSIFACGQAYTALSRARNMKSIRLINVLGTSFKTSPEVLAFHSKYSIMASA